MNPGQMKFVERHRLRANLHAPQKGQHLHRARRAKADGWKNEIHRQQWRNSLRDHAASLKHKPVREISTEDVLAVLGPIWLTKPETARRVRGHIERILAAAKARGLRSIDSPNPALWKGHLEVLLPRQSKLTRGHHAALAWAEAPAFFAAFLWSDGPGDDAKSS